MNSMARPDSSDFTLAAELLGLPAVSQGFSAKASYILLPPVKFECCIVRSLKRHAHETIGSVQISTRNAPSPLTSLIR